MKKLFSTTMTNTGGRNGDVSSPDKSLQFKMGPAGTPGTTNPEQLFAAGYSSCFNSALEMILAQEGIKGSSTVTAIVSLYEDDDGYHIGADIEGHIDGLSKEKTEEMLQKAHAVCPYSKATRGNVEVTVKAV